ncbi:DUF6086 family protein [Streptomyces chiangmaiensis]
MVNPALDWPPPYSAQQQHLLSHKSQHSDQCADGLRAARRICGVRFGWSCGQRPRGECDVDLPVFRAFVERLYRGYASTSSPHIHGFMRSLLITSLILLESAGTPLALKPEHEEAFREERATLTRAMG